MSLLSNSGTVKCGAYQGATGNPVQKDNTRLPLYKNTNSSFKITDNVLTRLIATQPTSCTIPVSVSFTATTPTPQEDPPQKEEGLT